MAGRLAAQLLAAPASAGPGAVLQRRGYSYRADGTLAGAPQDQIDERFYAIVTDLIGAPAELVAEDGTLAGYQQRTLWGTTLWHPDGAASPLRFPGQYHDPETGLHYNHQRYYDPVTGRYLTPDPLGLAPAPNPHTYVPNTATRSALCCPASAGTPRSTSPRSGIPPRRWP